MNLPPPRALAVLATLLAACGQEARPPVDDKLPDAGEPAGNVSRTPPQQDPPPRLPVPDGGPAGPSVLDPLAPFPDDPPAVLHDVDADLKVILEQGELDLACARYFQGRTDRRTKLLCGKKMFFDETFGTPGVPAAIPRFLVQHLSDQVGPGFMQLGLIPDPRSEERLPLGLAETTYPGRVPQLAFTCASCHFARLPDGRYAVGAPNHAYAYGRHILQMTVFPAVAMSGKDETHHPLALEVVQPLVDRVRESPTLKARLALALLPLLTSGATAASLPYEVEGMYASWAPGAMDFLIEPLPTNDKVHTVHKIPALWSIADSRQTQYAGMPHGMLGWSGGTRDVMDFLRLFVVTGGGAPLEWPDHKLEPLAAYIYSLRQPKNLFPPPEAEVERGLALFASKGCVNCHHGPAGTGLRTFRPEEIGTDPAIALWLNPDERDEPCCTPALRSVEITRGVKAPRLVGLWAASRFLHNGALASLEELFCRDEARPTLPPPLGTQGHSMTCENLRRDEADDLIAYLRAR